MAINSGTNLRGFPFVNHARNVMNDFGNTGDTSRVSMVHPRLKYTFLVEFGLSPNALTATNTDIERFITDGSIYGALQSIDRPKTTMTTEKLPSYNKRVIVPTGFEHSPASMTFHDDNTSMSASLWAAYRAFYSNEAKLGLSGNPNPDVGRVRTDHRLTGSMRSSQADYASLGLTVRPDDSRHFFEYITIYDLGSEPNSMNVYVFLNPVITALDHDRLDHADAGVSTMTFGFDFEHYYFYTGIPATQSSPQMESVLGLSAPTDYTASSGYVHGTRVNSDPTHSGVISSTTDATTGVAASTLTDVSPLTFPPGVTTTPLDGSTPVRTANELNEQITRTLNLIS